jgi:hypothetical protein
MHAPGGLLYEHYTDSQETVGKRGTSTTSLHYRIVYADCSQQKKPVRSGQKSKESTD